MLDVQPNQISIFVTHSLESIAADLAMCKISLFNLVSVAEQAGLKCNHALSRNIKAAKMSSAASNCLHYR